MRLRILIVRAVGAWGRETEKVLKEASRTGDAPRVVTVGTGEEAVEEVTREPVDLVIADLVLPRPGLSGVNTLVRVRELCPDCRTLLVSDHHYVEPLVGEVADAFLVRSPRPRTIALGLQIFSLTRELLAGYRPRLTGPGVAARTHSQVSTVLDSSDSAARRKPGERAAKLVAGKYLLGTKLGQGGMGEVFRAEDTFIQRSVAIKLLRVVPTAERAVQLRRRMHREVMIAGRLAHPNIVTVHDAGFDGKDMYLVMALVDGPTLRDLIEERHTVPRDEAITITRQILAALRYAHGKGVVHRDLKPSNVLLARDGTVKVADFGLAKIRSLAAEEEESHPSDALRELTAVGMVLGTVGYMAPEQMLGWASDQRSDLYSLGAMLWEMLHGRPLAKEIPPVRVASCLQHGRRPPDLRELPGEPQLDRILCRALAVQPEERFQTAESFANELREAG